jgi:hypothetical protein
VARRLGPTLVAAKTRVAKLVSAMKPKARNGRGGGRRESGRGASADE